MTDKERQEIAQRADAATPGAWIVVGAGRPDHCVCRDNGDGTSRVLFDRVETVQCDPLDTSDADFVAHAREDVPALLAALAVQDILFAKLANDSDACRMGAEGERAAILAKLDQELESVRLRNHPGAVRLRAAITARGPATTLPTDLLLARLERYEQALKEIVAAGEAGSVSSQPQTVTILREYVTKVGAIALTALQGGTDATP